MINTFYSTDTLDTSKAFLAAMLVGFGFGFVLERAGFGSSRKLAGIFYLKDMTVFKVMFTAVLTCAFGLHFLIGTGMLGIDAVYYLPTVYGAYIVGGLIFGVGFVMSGWCPGTAVTGLACGKIDALIFLFGAMLGSSIFNDLFRFVKPLYEFGNRGTVFVYDSLGISRAAFLLILSIGAIACFWLCEYIEKRNSNTGYYWRSRFLIGFSVLLLIAAAAAFLVNGDAAALPATPEMQLLNDVSDAKDHIEPEELADRLMAGEEGLVVIDIRTAGEFEDFHIQGAINVQLTDLRVYLDKYRNKGIVVLYSNGMTHPAQARDSLYRQGFNNVYILTDGLGGFMERCLKPASLRSEPVAADTAEKIKSWRSYFLTTAAPAVVKASTAEMNVRGLVSTDWLAEHLTNDSLVVIDLRPQPEYNTAHIPGSLCLSVENFRCNDGGAGSMLLPFYMLASHYGLMGITQSDTIIFVYGDKLHDASLAAMSCQRLGHRSFGILDGGYVKWIAENRPTDNRQPVREYSDYPVYSDSDTFTVDYKKVKEHLDKKDAVIIDVRPADYYSGEKSDEARAGHIPGAVNRPFTEDVDKSNTYPAYKSTQELAAAYSALIPSKDSLIIVHCRTGHQASQTFFVLKHLLDYKNVLWYDAGWSQWAAIDEMPVEK